MTRNIYAGIPGRPSRSSAQLADSQGVILDRYGNLYVTDCGNNRMQMFCPNLCLELLLLELIIQIVIAANCIFHVT
jgi:hypothetical protein